MDKLQEPLDEEFAEQCSSCLSIDFPRLSALPPALIPTLECIREQAGQKLLASIAVHVAGQPAMVHFACAESFAAIANSLPSGSPITSLIVEPNQAAFADVAAHDDFFAIQRVNGDAGTLFLRTIAVAGGLFHNEMHTAYRPEQHNCFTEIGGGFNAVLAHITDCSALSPEARCSRQTQSTWVADPGRRWTVGHQIFAALTQGLLFALIGLEAALPGDDTAKVAAWCRLAVDLLCASAAALRFTGDFQPDAYRDLIRPRMAPPYMAEGFSGLLSADHRHLVRIMKHLRPCMGDVATRLPNEHARFVAALQQVYDDHRYVCARFDGAAVTSLRRSGPETPAVVRLETFKRARLRLIQPEQARTTNAKTTST